MDLTIICNSGPLINLLSLENEKKKLFSFCISLAYS